MIEFYHFPALVHIMHESTLDLFCQHEDEMFAEEYVTELELKASQFEVTVDYYMMEFMQI